MNVIASRLYNAALAGPLPAQTYHLSQTRRQLNSMRDGRAVEGPNDTRIMLHQEDITMFHNIIDQVEDMFRELKKMNPKWEAEIKAQEFRPAGFNNNNGGSVNGIPAGPKRAREEEDEKERLDWELDRDRDDRRETWVPRQQQFNRNRNNGQFDRQRYFANSGFGGRLDNPNSNNKRRR